MTRHLLHCSCSRPIEVAATQAGGTIRCPGCGAQVSVPRLGELARLPPAPPAGVDRTGAVPIGRGWGAAHACVLAGVIMAAIAAAAAGWLHARRDAVAPFDGRVIVQSVAAASADQVYEAWRAYERQGIARPPLVEEERRSRQARALATLEWIAWATAAGCVALAAAAAFVVAARRPRPDVDRTPTAAGSRP